MVEVVLADLACERDQRALIEVLDSYACDEMGGSEPLSPFTKAHLAHALHKRPDAYVVLAFVEGQAAGVVNCFEGFSTFACQPLLNIHDVAVKPEYRGQGIARLMLKRVEALAVELGCCKMTLEVLEGNYPARALYQSLGFDSYTLDPQMGNAVFWQKALAT